VFDIVKPLQPNFMHIQANRMIHKLRRKCKCCEYGPWAELRL